VLVVEDDPTVREVLHGYLAQAGYDVAVAIDGQTALSTAATTAPDLVILDLMLPGLDGLEVCRRLRRDRPLPVIMLTALGEESDRITGLELGADDYITKPFSPREVVLRVRSVLRRVRNEPNAIPRAVLRDGNLVVDVPAHEVRLDGRPLALTTREFDLLAFLMAHPRESYDRAQLLEHVWGWDFGDHSTVTVHVRRLRSKIESDPARPERLCTVWGVGYRWEPVDVRGQTR
jgi:DNA-binding response OmpR family regulator